MTTFIDDINILAESVFKIEDEIKEEPNAECGTCEEVLQEDNLLSSTITEEPKTEPGNNEEVLQDHFSLNNSIEEEPKAEPGSNGEVLQENFLSNNMVTEAEVSSAVLENAAHVGWHRPAGIQNSSSRDLSLFSCSSAGAAHDGPAEDTCPAKESASGALRQKQPHAHKTSAATGLSRIPICPTNEHCNHTAHPHILGQNVGTVLITPPQVRPSMQQISWAAPPLHHPLQTAPVSLWLTAPVSQAQQVSWAALPPAAQLVVAPQQLVSWASPTPAMQWVQDPSQVVLLVSPVPSTQRVEAPEQMVVNAPLPPLQPIVDAHQQEVANAPLPPSQPLVDDDQQQVANGPLPPSQPLVDDNQQQIPKWKIEYLEGLKKREARYSAKREAMRRRREQRAEDSRKPREARQADVRLWRRVQKASDRRRERRRAERREQRLFARQRQAQARLQAPQLTHLQREVVKKALRVQTFWRSWHIENALEQEERHQTLKHHVAAVTDVLQETVAELGNRFPAGDLPDSTALTNAMLNMITKNDEDPMALIHFLIKLGIIKSRALCDKHADPKEMVLCKNARNGSLKVMWKCRRVQLGRRCGTQQCVAKGTILEKSKLPFKEKLSVLLHILNQHPRRELPDHIMSSRSLAKWKRQCRSIFRQFIEKKSQVGGPGTVVEIYESQIGSRILKGGARVHARFIVCGIERVSGKTFVAQIPDKKPLTLLSVIAKHVARGGKVITNEHGGYSALYALGYKHKRHSVNRNNPDAHKNTMLGKWSLLRRFLWSLPRNSPAAILEGLLGEYIFQSECLRDVMHPTVKFLAILRGEMDN